MNGTNPGPNPLDHQGLVIWFAHRYRGLGLRFEELKSAGQIGLLRACERYDPVRGKFSSYAAHAIEHAIRREIHANHLIHVPEATMSAPLKDTPNRGRSLARRAILRQMMRNARRVFSLDDPASLPRVVRECALIDPRTLSNGDLATIEAELDHQALRLAVERMLRTIPPRWAEVIRLRYGIGYDEPYTFAEVARIFRMSRERARQIELKSMSLLGRDRWTAHFREWIEPTRGTAR